MKTLLSGLCALLILTSAALASPDITLKVGDQAPALENVDWLKGEAVREYEKGHIYVLDFWATWCGPCVRSIPHINEMAKVRRDDKVTVIGVAIWPNERMVPTAQFVEERGEGMDYTIATDIDGKTADAYMRASGQNGIPTAMVIDREGKIAWIGHPMAGLDDVVAQVVEGTYDVEAEAKRAAKAAQDESQWQAVLAETQPLIAEFRQALDGKNWAEVDRLSAEIAPRHPNFSNILMYRYQAHVHMNGIEEAAEVGRDLLADAYKDEAGLLNGMAWWIVDPESKLNHEDRDLDLALAIAQRADEITEHKDPNVLDTLARVHFFRGDVAEAVKTQKHAIEMAASNPDMAEYLGKSLAEYEAALEG